MILLLPFLFGFLLLLELLLKLLGGSIATWVIVVTGVVFIVPIIALVIIEFYFRRK